MSDSPQNRYADLDARMTQLGRTLGTREAAHADGLERARVCIGVLRDAVEAALESFHAAVTAAGAPHLRVTVGDIRTDDKHLRSIEFDLVRGRYKAIVTAKSRGDVTLVGPFRLGSVEGPCLTFPFDSGEELDQALTTFLESFLEEAATP